MDNTGDTIISVIVPVYNVDAYLRKCLDSIAAQTFRAYEVILVDDGSTDGSRKICDCYAKVYDHYFVYHKNNGGLSSARNYGVMQAKGQYITFVDSDDYISEHYLEVLYALIAKYSVSIAIAGLTEVDINGNIKYRKPQITKHDINLATEKALEMMCYVEGFGVSACSKLYDIKLVRRYLYPEGKIYEDLATTYKIIGSTDTVAYTAEQIYYYVQRPDSTTHKKISRSDFIGVKSAEAQLNYMQKFYPAVVHAAKYRYCMKAIEYIPSIFELHDRKTELAFFRYIKKCIKKYWIDIIQNPKGKISVKVRCSIVMSGYRITKLSYRVIRLIERRNLFNV